MHAPTTGPDRTHALGIVFAPVAVAPPRVEPALRSFSARPRKPRLRDYLRNINADLCARYEHEEAITRW